MPCRERFGESPRQTGIVLITGLIFMVVVTLVVLGLLYSGTLEERMAANTRNRNVALQAAEAVLRDAEVSLFQTGFTQFTFTDSCTNGFCTRDPSGTPRWKTVDWTSTSTTRSFASADSNISASLVASQPRYIVEPLGVQGRLPGGGGCTDNVYQVTARGVGQDASEVFVQSLFQATPGVC